MMILGFGLSLSVLGFPKLGPLKRGVYLGGADLPF